MREDERDLEEVERALSVLGGRHPDQVRAERLASEAAAKRRREHEKELETLRRRAWKRRVIAVVALALVSSVVFVVWKIFSARSEADRSAIPLVSRYVALGFDMLPRAMLAAQDRASVSTIAGDCYAFVATNGAALQIERATENVNATDASEVLACTCASETITVSASQKKSVVRALHIAGSSLGGSRAAAFRFGDHAPKILGGDDACADDMLASFARARSKEEIPKRNVDGAWLASHPSLASIGFTTLVSAPSDRPFAFAPPRAASCFLAVGDEGDALTLWALDATAFQKPIERAKNAIAWCAEKESTFALEHDGKSAVTVVAAPAARVGGMLGLREIARAENLAIQTWTREDERSALAIDTLRASVVPDPTSAGCESIDPARTKTARVLLFASDGPTFSTTDLDVRCAPSLGAPESLCVQARALAWRAPPPKSASEAGTCAVAYGPLPYWMSAVSEIRDASAELLDEELALIAFARKLTARGFVPGILEGITEKSDSVEILGRSGDDAIVAVGLWPLAPFVHPYTDGAAWTLDTEPRVIAVKGGERVTLHVPNGNVPIDKRRTVVFRHSQSQAIH